MKSDAVVNRLSTEQDMTRVRSKPDGTRASGWTDMARPGTEWADTTGPITEHGANGTSIEQDAPE